jgi:hypothetical protein
MSRRLLEFQANQIEAVLASHRLPAQVCGGLVLLALQRLSKKGESERYPAQPPVVIVNPPSHQGSRFSEGSYFRVPSQEVRPRDFKIIGHEGGVDTKDDVLGQRR